MLILTAALPAPAAADVLDQSPVWTTPDSSFAVGANAPGTQSVIGQIVTAGLDGYLTRVQVYLENDATVPVTGGLLISIQTVTSDGLPSGREITNGTVGICTDTPAGDCIPPAGSPGWVEVRVSRVVVTAGTRYALVLRAWGGGFLRWYHFIGPSAYSSGYMVGTSGSGWWAGTYDDMMFRTYVAPPVLDQSQTVSNGYFAVQQNVSLGYWWKTASVAQTFTAGTTGYLHRVRVRLENVSASGPIAVSIRTVDMKYDGAYPSGTQIGSGTIPVAKLTVGAPGWVDVTLNDPVVTQGSQYAIILSMTSDGWIKWYDHQRSTMSLPDVYPQGHELVWTAGAWWNLDIEDTLGPRDATFETYVLPPITYSPPPPPRVITPCVNRVCPETKGGLTPADFTDGITTHFLFKERLNGTVQGIFNFTDAWPDGVSFQGCTTESTACRLTVTTFRCTDPHTMTVAGSYRRPQDAQALSYRLTVSGTRKGSGTFTLNAGGKTYTLTRDRIVDVICPSGGTP
jgi:hypothetical protein